MANYEPKTRETDASVEDFLRSLENVERQADCFRILEVFKRVTREKPKMWGTAIIGFGHRVLKYESGRELDWPIAAFSPRKGNITLYVLNDSPKQPLLLEKLGKHKASGGCLHIKRFSDVNEKVLETLIKESVIKVKKESSGPKK